MDILWLFCFLFGWICKALGVVPIPGFSLFGVIGDLSHSISSWASMKKDEVSPVIRIISDVVAFALLIFLGSCGRRTPATP